VHRHLLERRVVLEHEPDLALLGRLPRDVLLADEDRAAIGRVEPGDQPQQG
jgi:hypothetical protein